MNFYLDSSALVKRYVREPYSDQVLELLRGPNLVGTAYVAVAEVNSAFGRLHRAGKLDTEVADSVRSRFASDAATYAFIPVDMALANAAGEMAWRHGLRGFDSVHLAAGVLWSRLMTGQDTIFATFDKQLARAARAEGLNVWPEDI